MRLLFDTEGNGLLDTLTKIHCIAAVDPDTGQWFDWRPDQLQDALSTLAKADVLVAHNGIGYDFPALQKVLGFTVAAEKQRDSLVMARLIRSSLKDTDAGLVKTKRLPGKLHGSHSLEAWGYRLGCRKTAFDGPWDVWTPQMHSYMIDDVGVLLALWNELKPDNYSQRAIELEHRIAILVRRMEAEGWPFDIKGAERLHVQLLTKQEAIAKDLVAEFGSWYEPVKKSLDKHGIAKEFTPKRDNKKLGYVAGQPCTQIEKVTFNPSSRRHITRKLKQLGWKPQEFTDSGEPKLSDEVLETMADDFPQASKLVEYLLLDKRLGQLAEGDKAWLKVVGKDGRIHGSYNTMGTVHGRASHHNPNLGQVPSSKSPYGKECRELFVVPEGWVGVGADMAGLQLRALAHYLHPFDGGAYSKIVCEGDPHWAHAQAFGLVGADVSRDRDNGLHEVIRDKGAKVLGYARIFGCFANKAGSVIRDCCTTARAKDPAWGTLYERFFGAGQTNRQVGEQVLTNFDKTLNLDKLQSKLRGIMSYNGAERPNMFKGHIPGLDGRWVPCRSEHSALNFALSSAEAILCKTWITDAHDEMLRRGYRWGWEGDFTFMGWIHDEIQAAAREGLEQELGDVLVQSAIAAGEKLGFRAPLASEYKTGSNWADTH
jgi:DNA polymerase-1